MYGTLNEQTPAFFKPVKRKISFLNYRLSLHKIASFCRTRYFFNIKYAFPVSLVFNISDSLYKPIVFFVK